MTVSPLPQSIRSCNRIRRGSLGRTMSKISSLTSSNLETNKNNLKPRNKQFNDELINAQHINNDHIIYGPSLTRDLKTLIKKKWKSFKYAIILCLIRIFPQSEAEPLPKSIDDTFSKSINWPVQSDTPHNPDINNKFKINLQNLLLNLAKAILIPVRYKHNAILWVFVFLARLGALFILKQTHFIQYISLSFSTIHEAELTQKDLSGSATTSFVPMFSVRREYIFQR